MSTEPEKISKNFQSLSQVINLSEKNSKYECPVVKYHKIFENILSPNRKWISKIVEQEKISKFKSKESMDENQKINLKFRLAEIFSNFS